MVDSDGNVEFFLYVAKNDIYWIRDTVQNPVGPGELMPFPVNEDDFTEDNPHLERVNDTTLVLFIDNHAGAGSESDIFYTISHDNGETWMEKVLLSSINNDHEDIHPHFWSDGIDNWLYFSSTNIDDPNERLAIFRAKQMDQTNFNSWGERELVISAGEVTDGSGFITAVGEPNLTTWGDLSFVAVAFSLESTDTTDMFEINPWYLPTKNPVHVGINENEFSKELILFPNPATSQIQLNLNGKFEYSIVDLSGKVYMQETANNSSINISELTEGMYIIQAFQENNVYTSQFTITR